MRIEIKMPEEYKDTEMFYEDGKLNIIDKKWLAEHDKQVIAEVIDKIKAGISEVKNAIKTENSDYLTGYVSALSAIEDYCEILKEKKEMSYDVIDEHDIQKYTNDEIIEIQDKAREEGRVEIIESVIAIANAVIEGVRKEFERSNDMVCLGVMCELQRFRKMLEKVINEEEQKSIINDLAPKALEPYIPETEESKRFHAVSEALSKVGIHGEENTIRTYEALGWSTDCGTAKGE